MAAALGEVGADPSIGDCACLRRELSGEPDVVNLHLRFDEGRAGRATRVAFSPTLPVGRMVGTTKKNGLTGAGLLMEVARNPTGRRNCKSEKWLSGRIRGAPYYSPK
jgi:hypothetical protein